QEATEATGRRDPFAPPDSQAQRLNLAGQLLDVDVPRALQFADPALTAISMQGLNFLSFLRDKDPAAADQRYLRMLSRAAADLESDANTVSLLSSYLFTPHMFFTFDNQGGTSSSQMGRPTSPPTPTPELRNAFFQVAAQILTRPLAPPEQDRTTTGLEGKYLVIKRLMPLFEQYAAPQTTDMLRGQLAALGANVRDELRKRDDDVMRRGIRPEEDSADREQTLRDHIERAKTSEERDQLYIELIMLSLRKGDTGARDLVEKIEDSDLRKQVRPYVDVSLVINAVDKKQVEDAHRLALSGELTHFQRVWALTQVARQLTETDREKALTVLEAAAEEARRIDGSDADRPRALIGVANALFALDRTRSWELVTESVKAANSANGFTGEDARIMLRLQTANITQVRSNSAENFDLPSIFRVLTKDSYDRAVALARNFEGDSPRATALISIARTVLEQN
ncbi:MAG TPA: hypothetical protein VK208_17540, partial [Pyrinomonadaceae bacterium]|nr:hypothetical protein [Pyrinomonadaceae bacterium]